MRASLALGALALALVGCGGNGTSGFDRNNLDYVVSYAAPSVRFSRINGTNLQVVPSFPSADATDTSYPLVASSRDGYFFAAYRAADDVLLVANNAGRTLATLPLNGDVPTGLALSGDGSQIAYTAANPTGGVNLKVINQSGTALAAPVPLEAGVVRDLDQSGDHVLLGVTGATDALVVYTRSTNGSIRVTPANVSASQGAISDDGSRVVFATTTAADDPFGSDLGLVDADGGNPQVFATPGTGESSPRFAPANRIVFLSVTANDNVPGTLLRRLGYEDRTGNARSENVTSFPITTLLAVTRRP